MSEATTSLLMSLAGDMGRFARHQDGLRWSVDDHGWIMLSGIEGSADFNVALVAAGAPVSLLEGYVRDIRDAHLDALLVVDRTAPDLVGAAERLGLKSVGEVPVMVRGSDAVGRTPTGLEVRLATADDMSSVRSLVADAFSFEHRLVDRVFPDPVIDDIDVWVVADHGEAVGTGWFVHDGDSVGVYNMATPQRFQRRGVGRAVLEMGMAHYLARGAQRFVLEATEAGFHLYEQLGFETAASPRVFVIGESTQFPG